MILLKDTIDKWQTLIIPSHHSSHINPGRIIGPTCLFFFSKTFTFMHLIMTLFSVLLGSVLMYWKKMMKKLRNALLSQRYYYMIHKHNMFILPALLCKQAVAVYFTTEFFLRWHCHISNVKCICH